MVCHNRKRVEHDAVKLLTPFGFPDVLRLQSFQISRMEATGVFSSWFTVLLNAARRRACV
jgi:hypothetical protein